MSDHKYLVGIDFGTLSGRAVVVDAADGKQIGYGCHGISLCGYGPHPDGR